MKHVSEHLGNYITRVLHTVSPPSELGITQSAIHRVQLFVDADREFSRQLSSVKQEKQLSEVRSLLQRKYPEIVSFVSPTKKS